MTEMETDDESEAILLEKRLIDVVFSWSFKDVLNKDLYKDKVKNIPSTFQSIPLYMKSFVFPLIEETHADLSSSFDKVARASTCKISSIEEKESNKPSAKCLYIIEVEKKEISSDGRAYEPEPGDLLAITDVKPTCVDDLNRPITSYIIALVQRVTDEKDYIKIQAFLSRPFLVEQDIQEGHIKDSLFLVSLINTTTNTRIWNSLSFGVEKQNSQVIQKILEPDFYVTGKEKCNLCLQGEVYRVCRSKILASNWLINLNDSQQEAVLNCLATKYCHHDKTTKLIWGPPGTGKTKTVSALLFLLLSLNCRTVTCAPTNIAVLEVSGRALKLVLESCEFLTYGLGDLVLFGNRKRMNIDNQDELLHIFLDHRAKILARCFTPASGWKYALQYLITLLEDTELLYQLYTMNGQVEDADAELYQKSDNNTNYDNDSGNAVLRKESLRNKEDKTQRLYAQGFKDEWNKRIGQVIAKTIKLNDESRRGRGFGRDKKHSRPVPRKGCNDSHQTKARLNFDDFVTSRLNCKLEAFTFYVVNFVMHLPTSLLSVVVARDMIRAVNLLHSLSSLLQSVISNGRSLKEVFVKNKEAEMRVIDSSFDIELAKKECLKILKSLPNNFFEPEDEYSIKNQILKNAYLLFCTASSSFKLHETDAELLVIDEAAQLKECESTIPLQIPGLRHAILIGDEWQLPAMVKSKVCEEAKFGRSLFERLALLRFKKHLLNLQYRMHPSITSFPNREFYQNQITDAPNVRSTGYQKHYLQGEIYGAYSFINVACGNEEVVDGHSIRNMVEVAVVCEVVANLFKGCTSSGEKISIGIISPYNAQIAAIKENLGTKYSTDDESDFSVDVRSVDGFQGGEKDVIIISAVRSNANRSIGFLSNSQRVNVALTRARHCLWIFGNEPTLKSSGSVWKILVHDARVRGCCHDAQNDKDLVKAMAAALIDIDLLDIKIHLYSVLFQGTRWKGLIEASSVSLQVSVDDNFWKAMGRIKSIEIRKKAISVLMKLSSDWQWPRTEHIAVSSGMSNQPFELCPVDGILHIVLTLETIMETSSYVDVIRVWDIRPLTEIPDLDPMFILCKQLDAFHL
ncbi:uncharacterized protein LOC132623414 isoform X1 [Lycium barbarum]|uniref:uncharacterized protein LOC132623414 isoform X1 n=1 Tax=Lycium barbarum TaxID=112863 RepID=UPI00293F45BE|nr:uncharacterized protein LOC132623414 isoform X1 [Lycium barbarum]XP_060194146.1 uncharacterized protein LOC132623414 isoform X1 [Lycium barbarum]XP_060194147.1 uncharacterized protein LOC132623414 isoform X1 [Lycium barbarum]